jgi:hypothetical protein
VTTDGSASTTADRSNSNGVQEYIERKDPRDEIAELRRELEVQAATQSGAMATQAAAQSGALATEAATQAGASAAMAATQAGQAATTAASIAGLWSTVMSGAVALIAGMFLGVYLSHHND